MSTDDRICSILTPDYEHFDQTLTDAQKPTSYNRDNKPTEAGRVGAQFGAGGALHKKSALWFQLIGNRERIAGGWEAF